ncbi:D-arabinitol 2-dehydrogenase [Pyrenophora tritici-repentis Pt-1C-BFP]|uniref:D-arabinitol 2-dehydrogenase n=1 Tax=Pyrenophora tritici-repentis (strain Pt-1C-BFP) TaxID=426418 RepID=B2WAC2_PYRTR|nr:D-arabinitol 2-dehydrogenase [Pyrenophora tritici-repentis Pt-1C-BFP]EDU50154.1 D-arabinitol 2-dehydrogenase [Pyrenophora tritici-repentis Pt-1C-BFP]
MSSTHGLPEFSLKGKVVLVSGAARGLGLTQAEALLEAGARVYALDRLAEPSADFAPIAEKAKKELGTYLEYRQIDETTALGIHCWRMPTACSRVNITGVMMTAQAAAKQMIKFGNGGSIVLIASMSGSVANRGLICSAYNASKAGVIQLARNLASEWGEYNIRVNTISPGYIVTAMVEELFIKYPERRDTWPTQNMLGRLSKPSEYRGAAVFLLSDASSFMTGSDLRMDGGHAAW